MKTITRYDDRSPLISMMSDVGRPPVGRGEGGPQGILAPGVARVHGYDVP